MVVKFTTELIDIRTQEPLFIETPSGPQPLTLLKVSGDALTAIDPNEKQEFEEKYKLAKLIELIYLNRDACEISIEDLAIIKKRIAKFYGPLVLIAVDKILEK